MASSNGKDKIILLIIDPQNDFHAGGSLAVAGSHEDSQRVAMFIKDNSSKIAEIILTMDSHHKIHIAHAAFWTSDKGESPKPFTFITKDDVANGIWKPKDPSKLEHCIQYISSLAERNRFVLCIWPEHCLIGTKGHAVEPIIGEAVQAWSRQSRKQIQYLMKGSNCLVEMYSAVCAEVPLSEDPSTSLHTDLLAQLNTADLLLICGQARSHCVNFTTRDILANWKSSPSIIHVLQDGCSSVPGFEADGEKFLEDMKAAGVNVVNTQDIFNSIAKDVS